MTQPKQTARSIKVADSTWKRLRKMAEQDRRTIGNFVRLILDRAIEQKQQTQR